MLDRWTRLISALVLTLVFASACGGDDPLAECPPNADDQVASGGFIMSGTCVGCHSVNLVGAERQGAPVGMDFDTPELIRPQKQEIYDSVVDGSMPPNGGLNDLQIEDLRVYLACLE